MALNYPDTLKPNNPAAYPIVDSKYVGGSKTVADLTTLYALKTTTPAILSPTNGAEDDWQGQVWYVRSENKFYVLTSYANAGLDTGWEQLSVVDETLTHRVTVVENRIKGTYIKMVLSKASIQGTPIETVRFPRVDCEGIWTIDMDDGQGEQIKIANQDYTEFTWGTATTRTIVLTGNITKFYFNNGGVSQTKAYKLDELEIKSDRIRGIKNIGANATHANTVISIESGYTGDELVIDGLFGNATVGNAAAYKKCYIDVYSGNGIFSKTLEDTESTAIINIDDKCTNIDLGQIGAGITSIPRLYIESNKIGGFGFNYSGQLIVQTTDSANYVNNTVTEITETFPLAQYQTIAINLPNLITAPALFNNCNLSVASIVNILNSLPNRLDGFPETHVIGFVGVANMAFTETTDTYTVVDGGVTYSLENCPLFTNDDANSSLRNAYVLAIVKNGWTVRLI